MDNVLPDNMLPDNALPPNIFQRIADVWDLTDEDTSLEERRHAWDALYGHGLVPPVSRP